MSTEPEHDAAAELAAPHDRRHTDDMTIRQKLWRWRQPVIGVFLCFISAVSLSTAGIVLADRGKAQAEAQRTCVRSYKLGDAFIRVFKPVFTPQELRLYVDSLPNRSVPVQEACP